MKNTPFKYILGLFLVTLLSTGCKQESGEDPQLLVGYWEIEEAYRNGQQTESLDELFFEFFADGTMRTNISGIPADASYEVKGNTVEQRDSELEVDYTIQESTDSTLTLSTTIRNFDFRFALARRIPQE